MGSNVTLHRAGLTYPPTGKHVLKVMSTFEVKGCDSKNAGVYVTGILLAGSRDLSKHTLPKPRRHQ